MNVIALDTSGSVLAVGACREEVVAEANISGVLQHSENLLELIDQCLRILHLKLSEIDAFACGLGPGSFTGLRIGLATLKGMLEGVKKPCYGFSSLDLIAENIFLEEGRLGVLVDAKREKIYARFYRFHSGHSVRETGDLVLGVEEVIQHAQSPILLTGDALKTYGEILARRLQAATFLEKKFWFPRGEHLIRAFISRYKEMKPLTLREILPRYLRLSEAEERKRERSGNIHASIRSLRTGNPKHRRTGLD